MYSLFPPQQIVLKLVEKEGNGNNYEADDQQSRDSPCVVAEVRIVLDIVAHAVPCADHLRGSEEDE